LPGWWPDEKGGAFLNPGMLSMQSAFWDASLTTQIGPLPEAKKYYMDLIKELKRELVHIDDSWLGNEAIELITNSGAIMRPLSVNARVKEKLGIQSEPTGQP
jgi:hypothetical protein